VNPIKIKSRFMSAFGRRDTDFVAIAMEAVRGALAGIDVAKIRRVYIASYAPTELCQVEDPFGDIVDAVVREFRELSAGGPRVFKTGAEALYAALSDLSASDQGDALVIGSEKMTHLEPARAAGLLLGRESSHDAAYGATLPALGALVTNVYMRDHAIPTEALHHVAVKNHRNASMNPKAHFRNVVTADEVASSPFVADPLRRLHCAPTSDGAAAVVLSRHGGDVTITGWGKGADTLLLQERANLARFRATARASAGALDRAGVSAGDIDVVEVHDAFTSFELINLEEMGFCTPGRAWKVLLNGDLDIGSKLAVNPSGGMKARGHPIGASGLSSCVELYDQLTDLAGARQHHGAHLAMFQSVGGVSNESYAFVLASQ